MIYELLNNNLQIYFNNLSFWVIIDVMMLIGVAVLAFLFFKRKNSLRLFFYFLAYAIGAYLIHLATIMFDNNILTVSNEILKYANIFVIVTFVIVYQADFKQIFAHLGRPYASSHYMKNYSTSDDDLMQAASEIVKACQFMSKNDIGAIIIVVPTTIPQHILDTGTMTNALLSSALLESIFHTSSPLHDGAVIVSGNSVIAAGCFLPLSQDVDIAKDLGTRHRAAIGISEETDVLSIVVSEETGIISTVQKGVIKRFMTPDKLTQAIYAAFGINFTKQNNRGF